MSDGAVVLHDGSAVPLEWDDLRAQVQSSRQLTPNKVPAS